MGSVHRALSCIFAVLVFTAVGLCPIDGAARQKDRARARAADAKNGETVKKVPAAVQQPVEETAAEKPPAEEDKSSGDKNETPAGEGDLYQFEKPSVEEESYAWVIIKTLFILGVMVGGFYYFFRFVTKKAGIQMGGGGVAQTLSVVPLGQNKFLQIIDLAGRVLILGVSDASINLIGEIKDKDEIDRIRLLGSRAAPVQPGGFQEFLAGQIGKLLKKVKGGTPPGGSARFAPAAEDENMERLEYIARQRERLKRLNGMNDEE